MEQNSPRELMQLTPQQANSGGRIRMYRQSTSTSTTSTHEKYDKVRSTEYRQTHHHGGSQIEDNLALVNIFTVYLLCGHDDAFLLILHI